MRKIGELKGKPIIEGNPNEIKKNQIHYKESDGNITLSERKEDNTLSSVTSGSGSDEGVKEYYYKVTNTDIISQLNGISAFIISNALIDRGYEHVYSTVGGEDFIKSIVAFRVPDIPLVYWGYIEYNKIDRAVILRGDIYNRIVLMINAANGNNDMTAEMVKQQLQGIDEITKEEYEAMITYKPE